MNSFTKLAALAALCAQANAACSDLMVKVAEDPTMPDVKTDKTVFKCDEDISAELLSTVEDAVTKYAGGYQWSMLPLETDYLNNRFLFTGDENGDRIVDMDGVDIQGSKGSILFVHSATRDCLSWLTTTQDENMDSIPKSYFD